jgi:hypothetical protein
MPSYIVNMRITHNQDFYVEAESEDEARMKALNFNSEEGAIGELVDFDINSVELNK